MRLRRRALPVGRCREGNTSHRPESASRIFRRRPARVRRAVASAEPDVLSNPLMYWCRHSDQRCRRARQRHELAVALRAMAPCRESEDEIVTMREGAPAGQ